MESSNETKQQLQATAKSLRTHRSKTKESRRKTKDGYENKRQNLESG